MPRETITMVAGGPSVSEKVSFWDRYIGSLQGGVLSETSLQVISTDCEYIIDAGVFGAGIPGSDGDDWPASRVRKGLVIGSVQSGKTASMLGVVAKAVDRGVGIVVILAGTRLALWRQTYERALAQLDQWNPDVDGSLRATRTWLPAPSVVMQGESLPSLAQLYDEHPNLLARALLKKRPIIVIAMKQADHILRVGTLIRKAVGLYRGDTDALVHMLVIDDEADDGSILDAAIEVGADPDSERLKNLPRHIARLWESGATGPKQTGGHGVFTTYVAYTATPQANILQADFNPLAPTDFIAALRTPWNRGSVFPPRNTTYEEPRGLSGFYTGGEAFYRHPASTSGLCVPIVFPSSDDYETEEEHAAAVGATRDGVIGHALRAYFVGAAARLLLSGKSMQVLREAGRRGRGDILSLSPDPHTMLIHPSGLVADQFHFATLVSSWSREPGSTPLDSAKALLDSSGHPCFDAVGLAHRLDHERDSWKIWLGSFEGTRRELAQEFECADLPRVVEHSWETIEEILRSEIFPHVALKVINSDPLTDDRPQFSPVEGVDGLAAGADDLLTVFVSGNVMARGVSLEGLTTSLFLRDARQPNADTQMQMQRWFGFRGRYLQFCRVFVSGAQRDLFSVYHDVDESLRGQVVAAMNDSGTKAPKPDVLQTDRFRATGKIANLNSLPLSPGAYPFVRLVGQRGDHAQNCSILQELLRGHQWSLLAGGGRTRGLICHTEFDLLSTAALLESFSYGSHDPSPLSRNNVRWQTIGRALDLAPGESPLFRPPGRDNGFPEHVAPPGCPYSIGAYLRLWHHLLSRRAPGFFPTDNSETPWSLIDLSAYAASAPAFRIGVRFGGGRNAADAEFAKAGIQVMERSIHDDMLVATWGSRNPGRGTSPYFGDQLFDYHSTGIVPPIGPDGQPDWRPRGHPGLLLFHVVGVGEAETVTVGMGIPLGGPDHFSARAPTGMGGP